ncbi:hypothetical protein ACYX34_15040 [Nitrospira sp. CMX1]
MDMSIIFLFAMGFMTCGLVAGLYQTVSLAVMRRAKDKRFAQK